jgi:hypothetical protein
LLNFLYAVVKKENSEDFLREANSMLLFIVKSSHQSNGGGWLMGLNFSLVWSINHSTPL